MTQDNKDPEDYQEAIERLQKEIDQLQTKAEGGVRIRRTWKPTVAGILDIIAGVLSLLGFFGVLIAIIAIGSGAPFFWGFAPEVVPFGVSLAQTILITVAVFLAILGILPLLGGIYGVQRRKWGLALAGSIAAIFGTFILGILATIFTAMSKDEFDTGRMEVK
ncbi:hypothetical protein ACFLV0_05850 [Chloroflexota bacterium]